MDEAPDLNLAYGLYERAGCYACHMTAGFTDLRKPGPDLTKISAKLTPEWASTWIRDPREVKASTWMPRFWYNSNNSAPEDLQRCRFDLFKLVTTHAQRRHGSSLASLLENYDFGNTNYFIQ